MLIAGGCAQTGGMVTVKSANTDSRVAVVVIHHTSSDFADSLFVLTEPTSRPVSSHYLIPEMRDDSYTKKQLKIYSLVPEKDRAWHAGVSYWKELTKLNNLSVGIELVNETYCHEPADAPWRENSDWPDETICFYPDYSEAQIGLLIQLLEGILQRHTEVKPTHIVGHSDIAPQRKIDPGPRFPWQRLYQLGYGAWYDDATLAAYWDRFRAEPVAIDIVQKALHTYGYQIEQTGEYDLQTRNVLRAFQMHFVPWRATGEADAETTAALFALIEKYYPGELEPLLPPAAPEGEAPEQAAG